MTMLFRQLKAAMIELVGSQSAGLFRVFGYQTQPKGASEFLNNNRAVRIFYDGGKFPKSSSSTRGAIRHEVTMCTEMIVTAKSQVDVAVLEDPGSTDEQRATALLATKEAAHVADDLFDELAEEIWQIYMDAENLDLGLDEYTLGKARWVESIQKDQPVSNGEYVILTGTADLTTSVREEIRGSTPIPLADPGGIKTEIGIDEDPVQKTGVESP